MDEEERENRAANAYVASVGYDGSYDALALKMAYLVGARTTRTAASREKLIAAFNAGADEDERLNEARFRSEHGT
jgi:hypothetical protein